MLKIMRAYSFQAYALSMWFCFHWCNLDRQ